MDTLFVALVLICSYGVHSHQSPRTIEYDVFSMEIPIVLNNYGRYNPDGLMYALERNRAELEELKEELLQQIADPNLPYGALRVSPLVHPLVLRCAEGDTVKVNFTNRIQNRVVSIHVTGDLHEVDSDGSITGNNPRSGVAFKESIIYVWNCKEEGAYLFQDAMDMRGSEAGTNSNGLFGALIIESRGAVWSRNDDLSFNTDPQVSDSEHAIVHPSGTTSPKVQKTPWLKNPGPRVLNRYAAYREFVIFFHDEMKWAVKYDVPKPPPGCPNVGCPGDTTQEIFGEIHPMNYRVEPATDRLLDLWRRYNDPYNHPNGPLIDDESRKISGEEVHHSSWLFGDPTTPVLPTYVNDPFRIHLIHAGVKETHVFHFHRHEWYREYTNPNSPVIDAISIGPGGKHTIVPFYGAGSRSGSPGDAIFHCHLYPHFATGMWGFLRAYDTLKTGRYTNKATGSIDKFQHFPFTNSKNRVRIPPLPVLPDREAPPLPTVGLPGYPHFMEGPAVPFQKPPIPPWWDVNAIHDPSEDGWDYRLPTDLEINAMTQNRAPGVRPTLGALFQKFPIGAPDSDEEDLAISAISRPILANKAQRLVNWLGHFLVLDKEGIPEEGKVDSYDPLVVHAIVGKVYNVVYNNRFPSELVGSQFNPNLPECNVGPFGYLGEVGLHTHLVKTDSLGSDGSATGYNYITSPRVGRKMAYRLWLDENFPAAYFHDHSFANTRQKFGLFAIFAPHPEQSQILDPLIPASSDPSNDSDYIPGSLNGGDTQTATSGLHKIILNSDGNYRRDITVAVADFVPLWRVPDNLDLNQKFDYAYFRKFGIPGDPIEPPRCPTSIQDHGLTTVNNKLEPLKFRARFTEPSDWFNSEVHGDPYTTIFEMYENDPLQIRFFQGSHEEPHSFMVHGMRWKTFRDDYRSWYSNQQTIGISEVFAFRIDHPYGPGDYMYKIAGIESLWSGAWGIFRVLPRPKENSGNSRNSGPRLFPLLPEKTSENICEEKFVRKFTVQAVLTELVYNKGDATRDMPRLVDPFARVFVVTSHTPPVQYREQTEYFEIPARISEPLVIRAYRGEIVEITLTNSFALKPGAHYVSREDDVPVDFDVPFNERIVSNFVSVHIDGLLYNVAHSDGMNFGKNTAQNTSQVVGIGESRVYRFCVSSDTQVGPYPIRDLADVRFHLHHGLVGALIVEPKNSFVSSFTGTVATIDERPEIVIIQQDGLRLYTRLPDHSLLPAFDFITNTIVRPPEEIEDQDAGQQAINYKNEYVDPFSTRANLINGFPVNTPTYTVTQNSVVDIQFVAGVDRERGRSIHLHGHKWRPMTPMRLDNGIEPNDFQTASDAILSGWRRMIRVTMDRVGDWCFRSAQLGSSVQHGSHLLFSVVEVTPDNSPPADFPTDPVPEYPASFTELEYKRKLKIVIDGEVNEGETEGSLQTEKTEGAQRK